MQLLLLGGSGFVSGTLARLAIQQGHMVWAVSRGQKILIPGVHPILADRNDAAALHDALTAAGVTFDACLDCICYTPEQAAIDLTVLPTFTQRLVVISTDSVYHPFHKTVPQTEEAAFYMDDDGYGCKKRLMEQTFEASCSPIRWTIFRPGHIFGPGSQVGAYPEHCRQPDLLRRMRNDEPLHLVDGGSFLLHPIYAEDLTAAMLACIPLPACENQIFCIGGPEIVTNADYFTLLGELIGHPAVIETVPLEGYLEAHPQYSGHLCHRAYSLQKLENAGVPLPHTSLRDGLLEQIRWLDAHQAP